MSRQSHDLIFTNGVRSQTWSDGRKLTSRPHLLQVILRSTAAPMNDQLHGDSCENEELPSGSRVQRVCTAPSFLNCSATPACDSAWPAELQHVKGLEHSGNTGQVGHYLLQPCLPRLPTTARYSLAG